MDIGTSSVRAALYDHNANPVIGSSVKMLRLLATSADGAAEIDAETTFDQVIEVVDGVLAKTARRRGEIGHVAISAFWHSLVGVDARGRPTTNVLGWADRRSRHYTALLRKRFDERVVHDRTGAHFHSSYWPSRLLWLRRSSPDVFVRTAKWLSFSDYVAWRLCGELMTSISMASGTGIFEIRKCGWDAELLRFLKIRPANLPDIAADGATFQVNRTFARRWPRLANARWFPAIGDGAADNIGSGCVTKNRAALMVGTSGAMRVAFTGDPPKKLPAGLWCYRIDKKRVVIGGALSDGGNLYQWLKQNLNLPKDLENEMRRRGAHMHSLVFKPFLHGERSTGYNEFATAGVSGLNASHDAVDIMRAAMGSVAYHFADIFSRLKKVANIKEVVVSGGALQRSPIWGQIIADVLGRDLIMSGAEESSSRGAVLLALEQIDPANKAGSMSAFNGTIIRSNNL